jgi:hypothetical protein
VPESGAVGVLRTKVERYLEELYGGYQVDADGDFALGAESARAWVRPVELPGGRTGVRVWSITNVGMRVDDELTRFLATENAKFVFGSLALDEGRPAILFGHTLLGEFLNRRELEVAVDAVVSIADEYDDRIKSRFGGQLFSET